MPDYLDFTDKYNTPIPPERQKDFDAYVSRETHKPGGKNPLIDRYDYDVNGDFLAGAKKDARGHGDDQFKKPNHSTFSEESQYNGREGYVGGRWTPKGYEPSQTNLQFKSQPQLKRYFQKYEKETPLLPAAPVPQPTGPNGQYRIGDFGQPVQPAAPEGPGKSGRYGQPRRYQMGSR